MKHKEHLTGAMYELLGMLDEYLGRFSPWDGQPKPHLERFYPGEIEDASRFAQLIQEHEKSTAMHVDWSKETEGRIYFYSEKLKDIVNSYYVLEGTWATLDHQILDKATADNQLRYLVGAYTRFGEKPRNLFGMANAPAKMDTIGRVLSNLCCLKIRYYQSIGMSAPTFGLLIFNPSDSVRDRLSIQEPVEPPDSTTWTYDKTDFEFVREIS